MSEKTFFDSLIKQEQVPNLDEPVLDVPLEQAQEPESEKLASQIEQKEIPREYPYDAIVVAGHAEMEDAYIRKALEKQPESLEDLARGHGLTTNTKNRALTAYIAWKSGLAPRIVLTGGPVWKSANYAGAESSEIEKIPNSVLMKEFILRISKLIDGEDDMIKEDQILTDVFSIKSTDNIAESLNLLEENEYPSDRLVMVSNAFHQKRLSEDLERFGKKDSLPLSSESGIFILGYLNSEENRLEEWRKELSREVFPGRFERRKTIEMAGVEVVEGLSDRIGEEKALILINSLAADEQRGEKLQSYLTLSKEDLHKVLEKVFLDVHTQRVINETLGREATKDVWGVWGPLSLIYRNRDNILRSLENPAHRTDIAVWMQDVTQGKNWELPRDISNPEKMNDEEWHVLAQQFTERLMESDIPASDISALELRQYRKTVYPEQEYQQSVKDEAARNPELVEEKLDIPAIIAALIQGKSRHRIEPFLKGGYRELIDEWRTSHEDELGTFVTYEDFCLAIESGDITPKQMLEARKGSTQLEERFS